MTLNAYIALGVALVLLVCLAIMIATRRHDQRLYLEGDLVLWRASRAYHARPRLRRVK